MKKSFNTTTKSGPAATAADAAPAETPSTAVATRPDSTVAAPLPPQGDMQGDFNHDDIRLPRINLIHKTSKEEAVTKFGIGSFVLNQELKLSDGKTPIPVVALRFVKDLIQKLPFESTEQPKVFKTEEEVLQAGGSLNWADKDGGNFFIPRGHIQLIIPMPEGTDEAGEALFPYQYEGVNYAMAILTVSSSAYTSAGKELATLRANNKVMRKGLAYGKLLLTSEGRKNASFSWVVPVLKFNGENSQEFVEFFNKL